MENKQEKVCNVLLLPIMCEKHSGNGDDRKVSISKENSSVKTTETYWPYYMDRDTGEPFRYKFNPDCDMSDFACGFYEILYRDILQNNPRLVADDGNLVNREFAGDTMTSVGKLCFIEQPLPKDPQLESKIRECKEVLKKQYHCLANFWLLPMELGRKSDCEWSKTSPKYPIHDFMDRFLLLLKYNFQEYKKLYPKYFSNIDSFKEFADLHFLVGSYVDENYNVIQYSDKIHVILVGIEEKDGKDRKIYKVIQDYDKSKHYDAVFNHMKECREKRAKAIAQSVYCEDLWRYFKSCGLITDCCEK